MKIAGSVFTQMRRTDQYFSPFYKDNFILIQFIVNTFIQSHELTKKIQDLYKEAFHSPFVIKAPPLLLCETLGNLVGYLPFQGSPYSQWKKGPLTHFRDYCEQFFRNFPPTNPVFVNFQLSVHQAWLLAIQLFELLDSLCANFDFNEYKVKAFTHTLIKFMQDFRCHFREISRKLPTLICQFCDDENVLLYLLRNSRSLERIYGANYLQRHFKCTMNEQELQEYLLKKYRAKGFESSVSAFIERGN